MLQEMLEVGTAIRKVARVLWSMHTLFQEVRPCNTFSEQLRNRRSYLPRSFEGCHAWSSRQNIRRW